MILIAVVVSSLVIVRRRLRYETWYFVHLYTYLAIALAFSHQIATGREFVGDPAARAYWQGLYIATLAAVVLFRLGVPALRNARHRLRVERVIEEAPGVVSLEIGGARLERAEGARRPVLLLALPDPRALVAVAPLLAVRRPRRAAAADHGQGGRRLRGLSAIPPGTRVIFDGPHGAFTAAARRRPRVALIAGGVGITPIRALLEDLPGDPGDITLVYRAVREDDVILRVELEELAQRRGIEVHYVLGDHRGPGAAELLSAGHLARLVPDIALRDVYVCGPPEMTAATGASLRRAGVPRRQVITERFASADARRPRRPRGHRRRGGAARVLRHAAADPAPTRSRRCAPRAPRRATPTPRPHPPGSVTAKGPLISTPFSSIQVQATVLDGKLIDVQTLSLTGSDTHTQALNARAEPILREEALKAGSADIDVVTGATYTSESWRESLIAAIEAARVD